LQADELGNCVCTNSAILYCDHQYLAIFLVVLLTVSSITGVFCYLNGHRLSQEEQVHQDHATELRVKLGITIQNKVILSTERVPFWLNSKSFTVIPAENLDAVVRLCELRTDFDIKQVDSFCIALRPSSCYGNICNCILQICRYLLNPTDTKIWTGRPTKLRKHSSWIRSFSNKITDESFSDSCWLDCSTQESRMEYFRSRICKLQILRDEDNALFKQLKIVVDEFTVQIGSLCEARYVQFQKEERGADLVMYGSQSDSYPGPSDLAAFPRCTSGVEDDRQSSCVLNM
jgi:hypothetical protein